MHDQLAGIADDNALPAAFDKVKAASTHLCHKGGTPDFTLDIAYRPPDDPAGPRRFGVEYSCAPTWVGKRMAHGGGMYNLHARKVAIQGEEWIKAAKALHRAYQERQKPRRMEPCHPAPPAPAHRNPRSAG